MNKLISFWLWVKSFYHGIVSFDKNEDSSRSNLIYELRWGLEREYWKKKRKNKQWDD